MPPVERNRVRKQA